MDYQAWANNLFQTVDSMDADKFASVFTDDGSFKFGNGDVVTGKTAVKEFAGGFFSSIKSISHDLKTIVSDGDSLMCRGMVTYTRNDSSELTVPFANYLKLKDGLAREYQVYTDISRLFQ